MMGRQVAASGKRFKKDVDIEDLKLYFAGRKRTPQRSKSPRPKTGFSM
jgi:hypothetical protein